MGVRQRLSCLPMRKIRVAKRQKRSPYPREKPSPTPGGVYLPSKEQLVRLIAMRGATDDEIEDVYGLGRGQLALWRKHYKGLDKAIEHGRSIVDGDMLFALYKTGIGYEYTEEQAVGGKHPQVLRVQRHMPGQFLAQKHWLASRKREEWPAADRVEVTGKNGEAIKVESRNELIEAIIGLVASKSDPEKPQAKKREASGADEA